MFELLFFLQTLGALIIIHRRDEIRSFPIKKRIGRIFILCLPGIVALNLLLLGEGASSTSSLFH